MALSNAEKQARWRKRHADQRRQVARVATLLMRRSHSEDYIIEAKVGWNDVKLDRYFLMLAIAITRVLKTDREIRQLRWALALCLDDRKRRRAARNAGKRP